MAGAGLAVGVGAFPALVAGVGGLKAPCGVSALAGVLSPLYELSSCFVVLSVALKSAPDCEGSAS